MKPGIYKDMSIEDYHLNREVVSSTGLKKVVRSTRDFLHYLIRGSEQKSHFDFGNAFEIYLMDQANGTNDFEKEVAVMPCEEWKKEALEDKPNLKVPASSKMYKDNDRAFQEENFDKYIIKDFGNESFDMLQSMTKSVMSDPVISKLLKNTEYQVSLVWKDEETGLLLKTRPDVCRSKKKIIVDIKTTKDASPEGFAREAANNGYPMQAIMQMDGSIKSGLMNNVELYFWLAVEKSEVPNHALYQFQPEDIEYFQDAYEYYLKRCAKAIGELRRAEGDLYKVPSYGENADNQHGILSMEVPLWYKSKF